MKSIGILACATTLAVAGCGTDKIDTGAMQRDIKRQMTVQLRQKAVALRAAGDPRISSVDCTVPDSGQGRCIAYVHGALHGRLLVDVTVGNDGKYIFQAKDLSTLDALLPTGAVIHTGHFICEALQDQTGNDGVRCGYADEPAGKLLMPSGENQDALWSQPDELGPGMQGVSTAYEKNGSWTVNPGGIRCDFRAMSTPSANVFCRNDGHSFQILVGGA